jgi:ataxin-3
MEGASNGGMLYHEVQESKLCAVHCVNTVLQGPFFSEFDLAAVASDLDSKERQVMIQGGASSGDFLSAESHNVSLDGDFSIQVPFLSSLVKKKKNEPFLFFITFWNIN